MCTVPEEVRRGILSAEPIDKVIVHILFPHNIKRELEDVWRRHGDRKKTTNVEGKANRKVELMYVVT